MVGGIAARCSLVVLTLALSACSGRVIDVGDDSGTRGGAPASGGKSGSAGSQSNGSGGMGGGSNQGGTSPGYGGAGAVGGASVGGTASAGGASSSGGWSSPGGSAGAAGWSDAGSIGTGGSIACRPDVIRGSDLPIARVDLDELCKLEPFTCGFSAQQLLEGYDCSPDGGVPPTRPEVVLYKSRTVGCGTETIDWNAGYGGPSQTFSQATGELIGGELSSDVSFGPCNVSLYRAGTTARDCRDTKTLQCIPRSILEGGPPVRETCTADVMLRLSKLEKRPDCDCTGGYPADACFGPGTCGCFCSRFVPLAHACAGLGW